MGVFIIASSCDMFSSILSILFERSTIVISLDVSTVAEPACPSSLSARLLHARISQPKHESVGDSPSRQRRLQMRIGGIGAYPRSASGSVALRARDSLTILVVQLAAETPVYNFARKRSFLEIRGLREIRRRQRDVGGPPGECQVTHRS